MACVVEDVEDLFFENILQVFGIRCGSFEVSNVHFTVLFEQCLELVSFLAGTGKIGSGIDDQQHAQFVRLRRRPNDACVGTDKAPAEAALERRVSSIGKHHCLPRNARCFRVVHQFDARVCGFREFGKQLRRDEAGYIVGDLLELWNRSDT